MSKRFAPLLTVCALFACKPAAGLLIEEDVAAIQRAQNGYVNAVLAGDWAAAGAQFAEDAVLMPMDAPLERGRSAIEAHFAGLDSVTDWTVSGSEIYGEGKLAYVRSAFSIEAYPAGAAMPVSYTGKSLAIMARQPDGRWLYVADIWNADAPLPSIAPVAGAAGTAEPARP